MGEPWGCGEQGNAIHFLRRATGMDFKEAIQEPARIAGLLLPHTDGHHVLSQYGWIRNTYTTKFHPDLIYAS
ncbi:CHC2 zinc finger domain-containing protein [Gorillibacterium sp. sgz500922]|uniref:CHC2 zinc finger domain-containing protein n=1 Tax=Gorillibacterium sp. sgz500922 TaxID=3446694 RepID=UPI003F6723EF